MDLGIVFTRVPEQDPCNVGEVFAADGGIDKMTTEELQQLNAQVDVEGLPVEKVAEKWLEGNGFIG